MSLEQRAFDLETDGRDLMILFSEVFGHLATADHWRWKYLPPWAERPYCWILRTEGRLMGFVGAVQVRGIAEGEPIPFFQVADAMIHPLYRNQHNYLKIGADLIAEGVVETNERRVINGYTNHRGFLWLRRHGMTDQIEKAELTKIHPKASEPDHGFGFEKWAFDDPQLDEVWEELRGEISIGLIRDARYLDWRYRQHPFYGYRLLAVSKDGETRGWIIHGQAPKNKALPVVDMLLPLEDREPVLRDLARLLERPLGVWQPGNAGFRGDESKRTKTHVYHFAKESTYSTEDLRANLYYTMGDTDWC